MSEQTVVTTSEERDSICADLEARGQIGIDDVTSADRLTRFRIARDLWRLCDETAQRVLLNDGHAHVRSAASISAVGRIA